MVTISGQIVTVSQAAAGAGTPRGLSVSVPSCSIRRLRVAPTTECRFRTVEYATADHLHLQSTSVRDRNQLPSCPQTWAVQYTYARRQTLAGTESDVIAHDTLRSGHDASRRWRRATSDRLDAHGSRFQRCDGATAPHLGSVRSRALIASGYSRAGCGRIGQIQESYGIRTIAARARTPPCCPSGCRTVTRQS